MNRPAYVAARRRLERYADEAVTPRVASSILDLAWAVLAVAEAINLAHKESDR